MIVTININTDTQLGRDLLEIITSRVVAKPTPPPEYAYTTAGSAGSVVVGSPSPPNPVTTPDVGNAVVQPAPPPANEQLPNAAPTQDPTSFAAKQERLQTAFGVAYSKDAAEAMKYAENLRQRFGADNSSWDETQLDQAITEIEGLARF